MSVFADSFAKGGHSLFRFSESLTALYRYITGRRFFPGVYLPRPALEKSGLPGLPGSMKNPVQLVLDAAMRLSVHKPFFTAAADNSANPAAG
jgi:hypothetical protein